MAKIVTLEDDGTKGTTTGTGIVSLVATQTLAPNDILVKLYILIPYFTSS